MAGSFDTVTVVLAGTPAPSISAPTASAGANDASGNNSAASGQRLPLVAPETVNLEDIARRLNELVAERQRSLSFHVDESSGRTVITVRHAVTHQVVRQIPSEEALAVARLFEDTGFFLDARI